MRHTSKGQLFFISENIFHSTNRTFNLPFDITYLNSSDSVSIKMTVYNDQLTRVDSVALVTTDDRYVCPNVHSIYNEKEKIKSMQKLCHEIAKAALKLRRAMGTENPTPVTEEDAKKKLLCHLSVIKVLFEEKFTDAEKYEMKNTREKKAERWSKRLRGEANV